MQLHILSGGAAQGLVDALAPQFRARSGCEIAGTFGAVGAMKEKFLAGAPADIMILTAALIADLARTGHVIHDSARHIGTVPTAVAVRTGDPAPPINDAAALRNALRAADSIYFPDPKLATAGIHFAKVIDALGLTAEVASRLRTFPNGATAMRELAAARSKRPIGCTQVTEILNTKGTTLVGPLPKGCELATVYTCGVCVQSSEPELAAQFVALITGDEARPLRERLGFSG
ncbi:MAG TPA: substrate-binding domain-containing protein [Xanthobacteraceae bacterium]|nr:substrate-binding domain-containing protein [Xanthobacteraceae bacterium]